ncbi:hypothetical protein GZH47_19995 [Paenibacillus rhizovicinus]|uniref:Uncharacterized protein n=1 Tax=Paenibacillus rhizovicinus TaxID=2704463 RepID=A0A6C0P993_9BACL|nr:hypothetical protein GZH47_19995 [Paenibacillus rhizovicinus]
MESLAAGGIVRGTAKDIFNPGKAVSRCGFPIAAPAAVLITPKRYEMRNQPASRD